MSDRESLPPEGNYEAVAYPIETEEFGTTYAQFGESKNKGTPQVVVNVEVTDGEEAGRRLAYIGYFTDKTTERVIESLRYFGFKGNDLAAVVTQKLDQKVQIVVEHEEYNGKWRAKITWVNRLGGGGLKLAEPMNKENLKRFAAQMKSKVMAVPEAGGRPANGGSKPAVPQSSGKHREVSAPPRRDDVPPPGDDDIPF